MRQNMKSGDLKIKKCEQLNLHLPRKSVIFFKFDARITVDLEYYNLFKHISYIFSGVQSHSYKLQKENETQTTWHRRVHTYL